MHSIDWALVSHTMSAFLTPLIAVIAVFIAYQQFVINRRQHRLALFEKRMAVFNATMKMIASVIQSANPNLQQCFQFMQDTRDHEFLFGPEVGNFINQVYSKAVALHTQIAIGPHTVAEQTQTLTWFTGQMGEARKVFLKYIDFRKP